MSEPVRNPGKDDFIPPMNMAMNAYQAGLTVGLPESHAWELAHDTYMLMFASMLASAPADPDGGQP